MPFFMNLSGYLGVTNPSLRSGIMPALWVAPFQAHHSARSYGLDYLAGSSRGGLLLIDY